LIKNIIALLFCLFFGAICFLGGFLYSTSLTGKNQIIGESKAGHENKFLEVSSKIVQNGRLSPQIVEGLSKIWSQAVEYASNFTTSIKTYLQKTKDRLKNSKYTDSYRSNRESVPAPE